MCLAELFFEPGFFLLSPLALGNVKDKGEGKFIALKFEIAICDFDGEIP